jgi:hypothetical protein
MSAHQAMYPIRTMARVLKVSASAITLGGADQLRLGRPLTPI